MVYMKHPGICTLADRVRAVTGIDMHAISNLKPLRPRAPVSFDAASMGPQPFALAGPDPGLPMPLEAVIRASHKQ